jgi:hypothetical protein
MKLYQADHQHVAADVEFAFVVQEGTVDVLLDDEGLLDVVASGDLGLHPLLYLLEVTVDCYSVPSV